MQTFESPMIRNMKMGPSENMKYRALDFIRWLWLEQRPFEGDVCGGDIQDKLFELGLLEEVLNPPSGDPKHNSGYDEGDRLYYLKGEIANEQYK